MLTQIEKAKKFWEKHIKPCEKQRYVSSPLVWETFEGFIGQVGVPEHKIPYLGRHSREFSHSKTNSYWYELAKERKSTKQAVRFAFLDVTLPAAHTKPTRDELKLKPEYMIWYSMWHRCLNQESYKRRFPSLSWRDFEAFYAELGDRPSDKHSLDRVDNSKGYGPGNCRWATAQEQSNNTSRNVKVSHRGILYTYAELARLTGIDVNLIRYRHRNGWDMDKVNCDTYRAERMSAIQVKYMYNGTAYTKKELVELTGKTRNQVTWDVRMGRFPRATQNAVQSHP